MISIQRHYALISCVVFFGLLQGCGQPQSAKEDTKGDKTESHSEPNNNHIVDIVTTNMDFEAPDTISSGWITFRLINKSQMVHFAVLERLPQGKHIQDHHDSVAPVFQNIMDNINGQKLHAPELGFDLPEWFSEIVMLSGPGFVSPGHVAETTVFVEPGTYIIECYVKTNGIFHSYNPARDIYGMVHEFTVENDSSRGVAPEATLNVDLSSEKGIEISGDVKPGNHTVAVHFLDQKIYEHYLGHDLHVVRLEEDTDVRAVAEWMNWAAPKGLETPSPAEFLGGTHEMPSGSTGYFNVELKPGSYAFIAEIPNVYSSTMLHIFGVSELE